MSDQAAASASRLRTDRKGPRPGSLSALARSLTTHAPLWALAAVILVACAAYAPVRGHGFVNYDDPIYITENPHVRAGLSLQGIAWAFTALYAANWHPVTWLSHMGDCSLFGLDPAGHHLMSLALHLANTLLLFWALARMTRRRGPSLLVAGLFALHPLHVESVAWVSERKDLLSTFFLLLTIIAHARYVERPSTARYVETLLLLALGLASKPMLVTAPFLLLLLDVWPLGRWGDPEPARSRSPGGPPHRARRRLPALVAEKIPLFVLCAASSAITVVAQRRGGALATTETIPILVRLANAVVSYLSYMRKMLWPARLRVFYPLPTDPPLVRAALAALVLAAITSLALVLARKRPYLLVGWLWFLGSLVPVLGLVQVGMQGMADRYTYIPLIGLFIALAWGAFDLAARARAGRAVLAAAATGVLLACAVLTTKQVAHWRDTRTLLEGAVDNDAPDPITHYHLANELANSERWDEAVAHYERALVIDPDLAPAHHNLALVLDGVGRREDALAHFEAALALRPEFSEGHNNLGSLLARMGRRAEADAQWNEALRLKPDNAEAHNNLGVSLGHQGRFEDALVHLRKAVRLRPDMVRAWNNLGYALGRLGKAEESIAAFRRALEEEPGSAEAHFNLALARSGQGRVEEAAAHYREALRADPDWPEALTNLALLLVEQGDLGADGREEAIRLAERASELTDHGHPMILDTLGAAYAAAGRYDEAIASAERALEIARSRGAEVLVEQIEAHLSRYRALRAGGRVSAS